MKTQIKKTAVMSLALVAMTFFTFSTASAQRGNQDKGKKQQPQKTVVTKRTPVKQINQRQVASYPKGSKAMTHKGINYRVSGNQFYILQHGRYVQVAPPRGMYYTSMPKGYTTTQRNGGTYYQHNGINYQRQRNSLGQFIFMLIAG